MQGAGLSSLFTKLHVQTYIHCFIIMFIFLYLTPPHPTYTHIAHPEQLLRHDNFGLFSHALQSCYLLFECCRQDLKLQLEVCVSLSHLYMCLSTEVTNTSVDMLNFTNVL